MLAENLVNIKKRDKDSMLAGNPANIKNRYKYSILAGTPANIKTLQTQYISLKTG